jgi:cell division protein FtsL
MPTSLPLGRLGAPQTRRALVLEFVFSGILVLAFAFIAWFSVYVVYKLYQGQR